MTDIADTAGSEAPAEIERAAALKAAAEWIGRDGRLALILWVGIGAVALLATLCAHAFWTPFLVRPDARALFVVAAVALALTPLLLLLLDSQDTIARGPALGLPVAALIIWTFLATLVAVPQWRAVLFANGGDTIAPLAMLAFSTVFAAPLLAMIANGARFARIKREEISKREKAQAATEKLEGAEEAEQRRREHADAEAVGAVTGTLVVAVILGVAWAAGRWSDQNHLMNVAGIGITAGTMLIFGIVIFLDRLPDFPPVRLMQRLTRGAAARFGWLAKFYALIDAGLVRIGAHVAGMEHRLARTRYALLASVELCLCAMAWWLPAPFGLVPAAVGLLLALSVSRLWAWVEDDRALAVITQFNPRAPIRVGFREDFRDETLLGFIFVLALIPIALMQAHVGRVFGAPLFENASPANIGSWFGYLGFELAKALPVVDWADIYGMSGGDDVMRATRPTGMHAVFAARAMVDLVLISALLQALSISARNRQQKALYAVGQIKRVDELIERRELARILSRPETQRWGSDVIDFRRYDPSRLNEIRISSQDERVRTFAQSILAKSARDIDPAFVVLARLAQNGASVNELTDTFKAVVREHQEGRTVLPSDLTEILMDLRAVEGLRDLKESIIEFGAKLRPASDVASFLETLMFGQNADRFQYTRLMAAKALHKLSAHLDFRSQVQGLLDKVREQGTIAFGQRAAVPNALTQALEQRLKELSPRA